MCTARSLESGDRYFDKDPAHVAPIDGKSVPTTAAERIRNTRDRKPRRAIGSLFATIIV